MFCPNKSYKSSKSQSKTNWELMIDKYGELGAYQKFITDGLEMQDISGLDAINTMAVRSGVKTKIITETEAALMLPHVTNIKDRKSFAYQDTVYLIQENYSEDDIVHEYGHFYIAALKRDNVELYNDIKNNISQAELFREIELNPHYDMDDAAQEVMTKYLVNPPTSSKLLILIAKVKNWFYKHVLRQPRYIDNLTWKMLNEDFINGYSEYKGILIPNVLFSTATNTLHEQLEAGRTEITLVGNEYEKNGKKYERLTRFAGRMLGDKNADIELDELATKRADKLWEGLDEQVQKTVSIANTSHVLTKKEYISKYTEYRQKAIAKGNIFHAALELAINQRAGNKVDELKYNTIVAESLQHLESGYKAHEYIVNNLPDMFANLGINIFEDRVKLLPALADKLIVELPMVSDIFKVGTTIDMVRINTANNVFLYDWKTTQDMDTEATPLVDLFSGIAGTVRNKYKLEMALRALMFKTNHPDVKIGGLYVQSIRNNNAIINRDNHAPVDMSEYLPVMKRWFLLNNKEVHDKIIAVAPDAFDVSSYTSSRDLMSDKMSLVDELQKVEDTISFLEHQGYGTQTKGVITLKMELYEKRKQLALQIAEMNKISNLDVTTTDISAFNRWAGNITDSHNSVLQAYKVIYDNQKSLYNSEKLKITKEFEKKVEPLLAEYYETRLGKRLLKKFTLGLLNGINVVDLFSFAFKQIGTTEVLITTEDAEWSSLTVAQKEFLIYIQNTMKAESDPILSKLVALDIDGNVKKSIYELLLGKEKEKNGHALFQGRLSPRFFPRVPITIHELILKHGYSLKFAKVIFNEIKNYFKLNTAHTKLDIGLPVKFLDNVADNYSKNLATAFEAYIDGILQKKYMDEVLAVGNGLVDVLQERELPQTLAMLKHRISNDLKQKSEDIRLSRTSYGVDLNKIILLIKKWTAASIMWFNAFSSPITSGLVPFYFSVRKSLGNSIAYRLVGINKDELDFSTTDLAFGVKEALLLIKDALSGNMKNNKLWLLAKKFKYLGDDFGYITLKTDGIVTRNPVIAEKTLFSIQTTLENLNALIVMAAQLHNMRIKDTNMRVYDAYKLDADNNIVWDGGIRGKLSANEALTELTGLEIASMKNIYSRMNGSGYRSDEKAEIESTAIGSIYMQFRKYLPELIASSMGSRHIDVNMGRYVKKGEYYEWSAQQTEGHFRIFFKMLRDLFNPKKSWSAYTPQEKKELIEALITVGTFSLMLLFFLSKFDDEEDENFFKKAYLKLLENSLQHYWPGDWLRTVKNPPASIQKSWEAAVGISQFALINPINYLRGQEYRTKEGVLKGSVYTVKSIPILSQYYNLLKFLEDGEFGDTDWLNEYLLMAR